MKKVIAFGGSNSTKSINKKLAAYAGSQLENVELNVLDLNDFEMPIYSVERETESGIPELAKKFKELVRSSDGIIISLAEHNGSYTVALKNIIDWISRLEGRVWEEKPMFLMATSPGGRGAQTVFEFAKASFSRWAKIAGTFSLPNFGDNFNNGITNSELNEVFRSELKKFEEAL